MRCVPPAASNGTQQQPAAGTAEPCRGLLQTRRGSLAQGRAPGPRALARVQTTQPSPPRGTHRAPGRPGPQALPGSAPSPGRRRAGPALGHLPARAGPSRPRPCLPRPPRPAASPRRPAGRKRLPRRGEGAPAPAPGSSRATPRSHLGAHVRHEGGLGRLGAAAAAAADYPFPQHTAALGSSDAREHRRGPGLRIGRRRPPALAAGAPPIPRAPAAKAPPASGSAAATTHPAHHPEPASGGHAPSAQRADLTAEGSPAPRGA